MLCKALRKPMIDARPIWLTFLVCLFMLLQFATAFAQDSDAQNQELAQATSNCDYWARQCRANWRTQRDIDGCMRHEGCYEQTQVATATAEDPKAQDEKLSQEELEQLVAPIALHPDSLLSQILMASTYPLDVVKAARWVEKNPKVTGKALEDAMLKQTWDPSIKSLTAFPQVLDMMNADLAWTQKLGDAFLSQSEDVLAAVQLLRAKADKAGNLESSEQQTVSKEVVTRQSTGTTETVYVIQPASTNTVYVPAYNPTVVYGTWPYPAYPPYSYYPPGWVPGAGALAFGAGVAVGAALWGNCNWGYGNVGINVNRYNNFNRTNIRNGNWNHNPRNRGAVPYRGDARQKFGNRSNRNAKARENFRGRADRGRRDLQRQGAGQRRQASRQGARKQPRRKQQAKRSGRQRTAKRQSAGRRHGANRRASAGQRRSRSGAHRSQRRSAYHGAGRGRGYQARRHSSRGGRSRGFSGGGRGGFRGGGGGFRGGGGRRGGGRR